MTYLTAEQRSKIEAWIHSVNFPKITQNKNETKQNSVTQPQQLVKSR